MIRGQLSRLFDLDAPDAAVEKTEGDGSRLRVPTVDERVNLYLQAVYGHVDVGDEIRSRIRKVILNAMALDVATSSEIDKLANIPGPTGRFDGFAAAASTELSHGSINGFSAVKDAASYEAIRPAGSHFTQTTDQRSEVAAFKSLLETLTTQQPVAPSTRAPWFSRRTLVIATSVAGLFIALLFVKDVLFESAPPEPSVAARQADLLQDGPQGRKADRQPLAYQQPSPDRSVEPSPRRPEPQGIPGLSTYAPTGGDPYAGAVPRGPRDDLSVPQGVSRVTKREVPALSIEETVKRGRELLAAGEISL